MIDSDILPVLSSYETGSLRDINVEYAAVFMNNVESVRDSLSHSVDIGPSHRGEEKIEIGN